MIDSFSYNAKNRVLEIEKYRYEGVTLLGTRKCSNGTEEEVGEGMLGSRADIVDFSVENNSLFSQVEINSKLIDTLEKLNSTLNGLNINSTGKEEVVVDKEKFEEEVTETVEEVTEMSTEEVVEAEEMSEEAVDETPEVEEVSEEALEENVEEAEEVEETVEENVEEQEQQDSLSEPTEYSKSFEVKFEISHDEILYALYNLIGQFEEIDNDYYFISKVYDEYFVMRSWSTGDVYGCKYTKDEDNVSLNGERYKLFEELLTKSEKAKLDEMRSNYSAIQEKLSAYEKAELDAEKNEVFADISYSEYLETEEFKNLMSEKDKYSVEELKEKAEIAFAKCVKKAGTFTCKEAS